MNRILKTGLYHQSSFQVHVKTDIIKLIYITIIMLLPSKNTWWGHKLIHSQDWEKWTIKPASKCVCIYWDASSFLEEKCNYPLCMVLYLATNVLSTPLLTIFFINCWSATTKNIVLLIVQCTFCVQVRVSGTGGFLKYDLNFFSFERIYLCKILW